MIDLSQTFFVEKRSLLRLMFFLILDAILIVLSVFLSFVVRFELNIPEQYYTNIWGIIALALVITLPIIYLSKLYHFTWAYVSAEELVSLIRATILSFLMIAAVFFFLREHPVFSGFPRSTLFITYFLCQLHSLLIHQLIPTSLITVAAPHHGHLSSQLIPS